MKTPSADEAHACGAHEAFPCGEHEGVPSGQLKNFLVPLRSRLRSGIIKVKGDVAMTEQERRNKIAELKKRNAKSKAFLERMDYIRKHDFIVDMSPDRQNFTVTVVKKNGI